jgi:hypothetical protein
MRRRRASLVYRARNVPSASLRPTEAPAWRNATDETMGVQTADGRTTGVQSEDDRSPVVPPGEPPCGHGASGLHTRGYRLECNHCGSFFDLDFAGQAFKYDASYPEQRGHYDPLVGAMKIRSLERWLDASGIALADRVVCEVGFGGAHCLRFVADRAAATFGIEEVEANLAHARDLGVPDVFSFDAKPASLPRPVDVWLMLDSFEHLPLPGAFLDWMAANSATGAQALVVAPEAGSFSERMLGRVWPHKVPDHAFHWSQRGLREAFSSRGFDVECQFHPGKYVSGAMVAAHIAHKFPALELPPTAVKRLERLRLFFNFGEMGLAFQRAA